MLINLNNLSSCEHCGRVAAMSFLRDSSARFFIPFLSVLLKISNFLRIREVIRIFQRIPALAYNGYKNMFEIPEIIV
jgi:hypothetical protein